MFGALGWYKSLPAGGMLPDPPISITVAPITFGPLHDSKKAQTPYCKLASESGNEVLASFSLL